MSPHHLDAEISARAAEHARRRGGGYVGPEHILLSILSLDDGSSAKRALHQVGISSLDVERIVSTDYADEPESGAKGLIWSPAAQVLLGVARGLALSEGSSTVTGVHALVALIYESNSSPHILTVLGASPEAIITILGQMGERVPAAAVPTSDPLVEMGRRVYFPARDRAKVLNAMLKSYPPQSVRWGWNLTENGRCWLQADADVDIEALVRQNVIDEAEVSLDG